MQSYIDEGKLAGLITTVARRGKTVYLEKLGWMDREAQRPMELDAIFRIASMTKPITAVAMMTLYVEDCPVHSHARVPIMKRYQPISPFRFWVPRYAVQACAVRWAS